MGIGGRLKRIEVEAIRKMAKEVFQGDREPYGHALLILADNLLEMDKTLEDLTCDGCEYGDGCPSGTNHGRCRTCHLINARLLEG